jgi:hypothetical protein
MKKMRERKRKKGKEKRKNRKRKRKRTGRTSALGTREERTLTAAFLFLRAS